jgi:hypothetical protein
MKPYFNDDFSKMLVERVAYSMNEASQKCAGTGAGTMCPIHGDADCNSSKQNRKEEIEITVDGEEYLFEKMDGKDDNGFKSCWKGYKKVGTKMKGGKEVNDCVKAGYEMIGEIELDEKAPPGAKYERMVKHIKKGYSKDGELTKKEKSIAYATAWKAKGKKEEVEYVEERKDMPGNQEKIDANKNGKVDAHDFAILRNRKSKKTVKEMWQLAAEAKADIEVMPEIDDRDPANVKKKEKKEKEEKGDK